MCLKTGLNLNIPGTGISRREQEYHTGNGNVTPVRYPGCGPRDGDYSHHCAHSPLTDADITDINPQRTELSTTPVCPSVGPGWGLFSTLPNSETGVGNTYAR